MVFILSGFLKGVDPLGFAYKLGDYFRAFGLDFMEPLALPLSFVMCAAELFIGLLLLYNTLPRFGAWAVLLFMAFFTPLTLYIAIFNPVTDCGCFGDAFIISNWETFLKNVPLFGMAIILFYHRRKLDSGLSPAQNFGAASFLLVVSFLPSVHGYTQLPLMDFRPYSIGSNIPYNMSTPPGAPVDVYKTLLYYQKDGVVQEFGEDNFPWQDTTWKFVESKSILLEQGYVPPITSFVITDLDGMDVTEEIIHAQGYYLLAVSYRLDRSNPRVVARLNEIYFKAREQGIAFASVTASSYDAIEQFVGQTGAAYPFLQADEVTLKTIIRSNPGLVLLKGGTVIGLWHYNNLPDASHFEGNLEAEQFTLARRSTERAWALGLALLLVTLMLGRSAVRRGGGA